MTEIQGLSGARGQALLPAAVLSRRDVAPRRREVDDPEAEVERFQTVRRGYAEELDALYMAAQTEMDHDKRVEMYRDIQQQVYDNANVIPLYRNDFAFARSAKIDGLQVNPFYVYQAMYWTKAN